jgi:hypothetical protein
MPKRSSKKLVEIPAADAADQEPQSAAEPVPEQPPAAEDGKNPAAVALGRLGGLKGGKARAAKLSKKRRSEIAKKAAQARWGKDWQLSFIARLCFAVLRRFVHVLSRLTIVCNILCEIYW